MKGLPPGRQKAAAAAAMVPPDSRRGPASMTVRQRMMEISPSKPRLIVSRGGERRKTTYLNGPPFIDAQGLVMIERRSREERRGKPPRAAADGGQRVCALLRFPGTRSDDDSR